MEKPEKVVALPPRQMSRDDRRLVFDKINDHYVGDQVGYEAGWSDERVATDLGVPRAWVTNLRDEMFGPELGPAVQDLQAQVSNVESLIEKAKEGLAHLSTLVEAGRKMIDGIKTSTRLKKSG